MILPGTQAVARRAGPAAGPRWYPPLAPEDFAQASGAGRVPQQLGICLGTAASTLVLLPAAAMPDRRRLAR